MSIDPSDLHNRLDLLEDIEKASTRMVFQAITDFVPVAKDTFTRARDLAGTVGEDITRDAMETMGLSRIPTARLIGKIDYKRAAYYFDPDFWVRQALFVDSKAERSDRTSATIQTSQTSLRILMKTKSGKEVDELGKLDAVLTVGSEPYLVTTLFVKYLYEIDAAGENRLDSIFIICLPNGMLQARYNPTAQDSIWRVGRHAPTRGEEFRVRISFSKLTAKRSWRVQTIHVLPQVEADWRE